MKNGRIGLQETIAVVPSTPSVQASPRISLYYIVPVRIAGEIGQPVFTAKRFRIGAEGH